MKRNNWNSNERKNKKNLKREMNSSKRKSKKSKIKRNRND